MPNLSELMPRLLRAALLSLLLAGAAAHADTYEDSLGAAQRGDARALTQLLNRGLDPNIVDPHGNTLLMLAAREGHVDAVITLIAYRAKTSLRNPAGDSALMMAALKGRSDVVQVLLKAGAEVNHEGWTPLMYAAFEGHTDIVEQLLARGADATALAPNKSNALMLAARNGHIEAVRRLLKSDIDLDQKNDAGFTAETWARANGNTDIADLLKSERSKRGPRAPAMKIEIK